MASSANDANQNIVLIGMPGAGKSTLGVLLAKTLAKRFVDTDLVIQERVGKTLQRIVDDQGFRVLRDLEADVLRSLHAHNAVVATGGSAVYSAEAMSHLRDQGTCVYLHLSLGAVEQRVNNLGSRGIAAAPGKTLADIYEERRPLYERYADIIIDCDGKSVEQVLADLERAFP